MVPSEIKMEEIPGQTRNLELSEKNKASKKDEMCRSFILKWFKPQWMPSSDGAPIVGKGQDKSLWILGVFQLKMILRHLPEKSIIAQAK